MIARALRDLTAAGASIVDPLTIPEFDQHPPKPHPKSETRRAMEAYLAKTGPGFPKTLADILASGKFHPLHEVHVPGDGGCAQAGGRSDRRATRDMTKS